MSSLLPMLVRDLSAVWSDEVYATDASPWGRGVAITNKLVEEVRAVGQYNDRWRFKDVERAVLGHPESTVLDQEKLHCVNAAATAREPKDAVPEVPLWRALGAKSTHPNGTEQSIFLLWRVDLSFGFSTLGPQSTSSRSATFESFGFGMGRGQ